MLDGFVVSFRPATPLATEVSNEAAVEVCVDGWAAPPKRRPVFSSVGNSGRLAPSNVRSRSRFLRFPSDISGDFAVFDSASKVDGQDCPSS